MTGQCSPACTPDGNGITYNEHVNVALAVAMPDGGLITPVLKDADKVDIYQLSRNWGDLVKRARSKQLQPDEYNSGTFTISNLGMFGVDTFDAILPPGEGLRGCWVDVEGVGRHWQGSKVMMLQLQAGGDRFKCFPLVKLLSAL